MPLSPGTTLGPYTAVRDPGHKHHGSRLSKEIAVSKKMFGRARKTVDVSVGESVRIIRELQEMSQNDLVRMTGIPQSTISAVENDRVNLGVERAKVIARMFKCHPAVLVFPGWELGKDTAA